jgi:small GTP-binding protein
MATSREIKTRLQASQQSNPSSEYDSLYKIRVIGPSRSGVSSLVRRFTQNTYCESYAKTTTSYEFNTRSFNIDGKNIRLQVWDAPMNASSTGQYRGALGVLLCFDISKNDQFKQLNDVLQYLKEHDSGILEVLLVGTKQDLRYLREVPCETAREFAKQHNMEYIEASAQDGTNVELAFQALAASILTFRQEEKKKRYFSETPKETFKENAAKKPNQLPVDDCDEKEKPSSPCFVM